MGRRGGSEALPEFLALVGPTGVGKTALSLEVGRLLGAEVVSMDSRQIYRGMDVGTGKVSLADRARLPHHGLDLLDPPERYSAGRFARDGRRWIREIRSRGRVPLLVGGTGFFLRALLRPMFREPEMDPGRREALRAYLGEVPTPELERWVRALDPFRAGTAVQGGPHRMIRTLEVALLSGRPLSWWHREGPPEPSPVPGLVVLLELPREELYRRIDQRVEVMVREGLVEEVARLLEAGYGPDTPGGSAAGYREIASHLRGEGTLREALEETRKAHRRYARRQLTWFRGQLPRGGVVRLDMGQPPETRTARVLEAWRRAGGEEGPGAVSPATGSLQTGGEG